MKRASIASAIEWVGTLAAVGWWFLTGVRIYYPNQGSWFVTTSHADLLIGLALLAAVLIARLIRTGRFFKRTPLDFIMLVFLLTAVAGWWLSYDHERNILRLHLLIGAVAFYYLLADATPGAAIRFTGSLILLAVILTAGFFLRYDFQGDPVKFGISNRIGLFLSANIPNFGLERVQGNPNLTAGVMALVMPFCVAGIEVYRAQKKLIWMLLSAGAALFLAFGIFVSASRGAMVALTGAAVLWAVSRLAVRFGKVRIILMLAALLAGIGVYLYVINQTDILGLVSGGLGRSTLYHDAFYLSQDYMWTGAGLGAYPMVYVTYSLLTHVGFVNHAHNLYLQAWLEQGLFGLLVFLWLVGYTIWSILKNSGHAYRYADGNNFSERWYIPAAWWASLIMLMHGLVDVPLYPDDQAMMLFMTFGLMVTAGPVEKKAWPGWRKIQVLVGLGVALLVVLFIWRKPLISSIYANIGSLDQTRQELSVYTWPEWPVQDEVRRTVDLTKATAWYEKALAYDPNNPTANRRLGMIALSRGDYTAALKYLEVAYKGTPGDNATRQLLGEAYIANGRLDEGAALWSGVNNGQSQLVLRAFWYEHIGDKERMEWMKQAIKGNN